jgi:hypothetical protein
MQALVHDLEAVEGKSWGWRIAPAGRSQGLEQGAADGSWELEIRSIRGDEVGGRRGYPSAMELNRGELGSSLTARSGRGGSRSCACRGGGVGGEEP